MTTHNGDPTMTHQTLVAAYKSMLALYPADVRADAKAHVDSSIRKNKQYGLQMVADIIATQVHNELGSSEVRMSPESWDHGMFLTGGHRFYDYDASNAWLKAHGMSDFCRMNVAC